MMYRVVVNDVPSGYVDEVPTSRGWSTEQTPRELSHLCGWSTELRAANVRDVPSAAGSYGTSFTW